MNRFFIVLLSIIVCCGFCLAEAPVMETTLADQADIAVTVYNNNRALVRDRRNITLPPGAVSLKFMDVAEQIQPETVSIRSLSNPGKLYILEQNYEYDLMSPQKLMEKYVGRDVKLINRANDLSFYKVDAKLLSVNDGPVYEIDGAIYLDHPGNVVLPEVPEELIARPSLIWLLDNRGTDHEVEATYLTGGMSWRADYVVTLAKNDTSIDLEGWVTLSNQSGATYTNAKLKLVAGEVNIIETDGDGLVEQLEALAYCDNVAGAMPMQEESFAEYHLYSLPRCTTIRQNQTKQVSLLKAEEVAVKKVYEFRGNLSWYSSRVPRFEPEHAAVFLDFENREENHLGMPLPEGIMRIYQEDSEGMLQFAGEDRIKHTPKDEKVRLHMGQAFDVVAERKQTDWEEIKNWIPFTGSVYEAEYEVTLRNHKESDIVVDVVEPIPADWKVLKESHPHRKVDAFSVVFSIPVRADSEEKLQYRIQISF